nr:FAD-dependent monooxygenase [Rhodococcus phenolicus]
MSHRVTGHYGSGRVFLAGDAAHTIPEARSSRHPRGRGVPRRPVSGPPTRPGCGRTA